MFANVGTLGVLPGKRDELIAILVSNNPSLEANGCVLYEVGANEEQADTVFVVELWTSAEAHRKSLELDSVRSAIAEAMPLLSGEMGGSRFDIVGSPLHD